MNSRTYDVIVAKEYEVQQDGQLVKRTAWNHVGRAWNSKSGDSLSFELYLIPNQRYVIHLKPKEAKRDDSAVNFEAFNKEDG